MALVQTKIIPNPMITTITTIQVTKDNRKRIQTLKQSLDLANSDDVLTHLFDVKEKYEKLVKSQKS